MPTEAGQNESGAYQPEGNAEEVLSNYATILAVLGATLVGTIIISLIAARMWDEDEIKLHILHSAMNILRSIARTTGSLAIECENAYNQRVTALH